MAIATRGETLGIRTGIATEEIVRSSKLLVSLTGMLVQRNKAIVGANAFAHEAGIHQDGVLKSAITYEIMTPQSVGIRHSTLVLGKHSGRHALKARYAELGYQLTAQELDQVYRSFCAIADQKKEVFDEELVAILEERAHSTEEYYHLDGLQVSTGMNLSPTATVSLIQGGKRFVDSATGDGPVDAAYKAIERITGESGKLIEYAVKSVSLGRDAVGEAFVSVEFDGILFRGRAVSTDVIEGSVRAYLEALNRARASQRARSSAPAIQEVS
jgi:2-isopropylmalate synthase